MDMLKDILEYDFSEDGATDEGGGIWIEDLHLTPVSLQVGASIASVWKRNCMHYLIYLT